MVILINKVLEFIENKRKILSEEVVGLSPTGSTLRVDGRVDEGDGLQNHLVIPHVGSNPSRRAVLHFSKFLKRGDCL